MVASKIRVTSFRGTTIPEFPGFPLSSLELTSDLPHNHAMLFSSVIRSIFYHKDDKLLHKLTYLVLLSLALISHKVGLTQYNYLFSSP